jgi:hypothetical protein
MVYMAWVHIRLNLLRQVTSMQERPERDSRGCRSRARSSRACQRERSHGKRRSAPAASITHTESVT